MEPFVGRDQWEVIRSLGTLPSEGINGHLGEWVRSWKAVLIIERVGCYKVNLAFSAHSLASSLTL